MTITFLDPQVEISPYCWLVQVGPRKLGVHKQRGWCMQLVSDDLVFFDSEAKCMPLVPILDAGVEELFSFLEKAANSNSDYSDVIRKFPQNLLIKHVFHTSFSSYWPEKAFAWLSADTSLHPAFLHELEKITTNKAMPQGMRQKAKKIVKSLVSEARDQVVPSAADRQKGDA